MNLIKYFGNSISDLVFPVTCACCGIKTGEAHQTICNWCRRSRFEMAGEELNQILPESVTSLFSMWYFDKGGYLQYLLHNLKYNHLKGVGKELGRLLAATYLRNSEPDKILGMNPLIVPVPLHKSRLRKRGYNQARVLVEGYAELTNWDIIDQGAITRTRNTGTQTGLTGKQRSDNLRNAFKINSLEQFQEREIIIIDDVFTTGATTFELASAIFEISQCKSEIVTVARA